MVTIKRLSDEETLVNLRSDHALRTKLIAEEKATKKRRKKLFLSAFENENERYGTNPDMDKLVDSPDEEDRLSAARQHYGLEILRRDPSALVRLEVARQGFGSLDIYVNDPSATVRRYVAAFSEGIDIRLFANDPNSLVCRNAVERLYRKYDRQKQAADKFLETLSPIVESDTNIALSAAELTIAMSESQRLIFSQLTDIHWPQCEAEEQALNEKLRHNGNEAVAMCLEAPQGDPFTTEEQITLLKAMKKSDLFIMGNVVTETPAKRVNIIYDITPKSIKDIEYP